MITAADNGIKRLRNTVDVERECGTRNRLIVGGIKEESGIGEIDEGWLACGGDSVKD